MNRAIIEQGFPIPVRGRATSRGQHISLTESLRVCCIGCSFLVDDVRFKNAVRSIAHRLGVKVRMEKTSEGLRVWRIS